MSNLKSRIERIEKRVAVDEKPYLTMSELCHYIKLADPEGFRREAMDPACHDSNMHEALHFPTPKRVIRLFLRGDLERLLTERASASEGSRETAHAEHGSHGGAGQEPGRKAGSLQNPRRRPK
jgi:hypothetical protein